MLERGSESKSGRKVGARKTAKAKGKSEEQQGLKSAGRTAGAGKRKPQLLRESSFCKSIPQGKKAAVEVCQYARFMTN